jgi:hypothetical protein
MDGLDKQRADQRTGPREKGGRERRDGDMVEMDYAVGTCQEHLLQFTYQFDARSDEGGRNTHLCLFHAAANIR